MQTVIYAADAAEVTARRDQTNPDVVHISIGSTADAQVVLHAAEAKQLHEQLGQVLTLELVAEAGAAQVAEGPVGVSHATAKDWS